MPIIEGVGVHLHKKHQSVEGKEDLGGPSPVTTKWYTEENQPRT